MSHPDPTAPLDLRPFHVGDDLTNPVTGEYAKIIELPWENPEGRGRAELLAVVGARVLGEHVHRGLIERFTVLDGELTVRLDGVTRLLHEGENAEIRPGQWCGAGGLVGTAGALRADHGLIARRADDKRGTTRAIATTVPAPMSTGARNTKTPYTSALWALSAASPRLKSAAP